MQQRIVTAVCFGLVSALTAVQINGLPKTGEGWVALCVTCIVAGWGKYSSSTTILAPDRTVWTPEQRREVTK